MRRRCDTPEACGVCSTSNTAPPTRLSVVTVVVAYPNVEVGRSSSSVHPQPGDLDRRFLAGGSWPAHREVRDFLRHLRELVNGSSHCSVMLASGSALADGGTTRPICFQLCIVQQAELNDEALSTAHEAAANTGVIPCDSVSTSRTMLRPSWRAPPSKKHTDLVVQDVKTAYQDTYPITAPWPSHRALGWSMMWRGV